MKPIPYVKPGDPITAELYNAIAERLEQKLALTVAEGTGLTLVKTPNGRVLSLDVPHPIWAQLSGTSSPYSWQEVEPTSGGGWSPFGQRAGTSNAYEVNGKTGLNGKVVDLWWTEAGDWRFVWEGVGCDPATTTLSIQVNSSCTGGPLADATVTITDSDGAVVDSGSPDATGLYVLGITKPGSYGYSVSRDRYQTQLGTLTISTCGTTASVTATLGPGSNYVCCNGGLYPKTLFLTTEKGTFTLVFGVVGFVPGWRVTPNITTTGYSSSTNCLSAFGVPTCCVDCSSGTSDVTVPVGLGLTCAGLVETWNAPDHCTNPAETVSCLPMVVGSCTNSPPVASNGNAVWPDPGGALPQTFILAANPTTPGCTPPIKGSAILSE